MKQRNLSLFLNITLLFFTLTFFCKNVVAQKVNNQNLLNTYLKASANEKGQTTADISDYAVTSFHTSSTSNITHYYLQQQYDGIPIFDALSSIHLTSDSKLLKINNDFLTNIASKISVTTPTLTPIQVLQKVASVNKYKINQLPTVKEQIGGKAKKSIFNKGSISEEDIPIQLMYLLTDDGELKLCWDLSISETNSDDWWSMRVDAETGQILDKVNWTVYCFENEAHNCTEVHTNKNDVKASKNKKTTNSSSNQKQLANTYSVFPIPIESPLHGTQQTINNPADPIASPFGWHDTNGSAGNEFTFTRGNNVWAREDADDNNTGGFSPDGTASLDFNFTLNPSQPLTNVTNQSAVITNLFYMNNIMHDVIYQYGFDEASGNFQANTYGNGGTGADWVNADAQDGSGTNNANMSVPADGQAARMQMFLWYNTVGSVTANAPASVAGNYNYNPAAFGATTYNVTGNVVIADDGSAAPTEACGNLVNGGAISGNVALIDRGNCEFGAKCLNAENAGAIAVIVCNNVSPGTLQMGAGAVGANVTIPAVMLSQADCATIRSQVPGLNVTIVSPTTAETDSDLDNGIIAHEYGHGISLRLTGGRNNPNCLGNTEQMGEGWSDFYGLMLTIEPGDSRTDARPIGNYALSQGLSGGGIRTYPYSTDFNINPHTYLDIANEAVPHGVGSVWCAMLWEMTWDLIDTYGFDTDIYYGTGGNNIAMHLVTEALKLQPCSPGMVDGRDAILAADQALYNGEYNCLIRKAFARRGLGDNATQGNANSQTDGSEDFNAACSLTTCAAVDLNIQFDGFPAQSSWVIIDGSGNTVASSNNYGTQTANTSIKESECLTDGCYTLQFSDALNNGMCPFQSSGIGASTFITPGTLISPGSLVGTLSLVSSPGLCGTYQLVDANGTVLVSGGGNFGAIESNQFCLNGGLAPKLTKPTKDAFDKIINTTLNIKPNLVKNELRINYTVNQNTPVNFNILDVNGKLIQQNLAEGGNFKTLKLNVANLQSGIYFVQMATSKEIITEKFIKN